MNIQDNSTNTCTVEVKHTFNHSAVILWQAWTQPELAAQFLFKTGHGKMKLVEIEARLNGLFKIVEERKGIDAEHHGRYLTWQPAESLSFVFGPNLENTTKVTLSFQEQNEGCLLTLCHEGVWPDFEERVRASWKQALERLEVALEK